MTTLTETLTRDDGTTSSVTIDLDACSICAKKPADSRTLLPIRVHVETLDEEDITPMYPFQRVCLDCRKALSEAVSDWLDERGRVR